MEQVTRRALFGLGVGLATVPVAKLFPTERTDDVLPPLKVSLDEFRRLREAKLVKQGWVQHNVQTYRVTFDKLTGEVGLVPK
jgi:hypothetical protein